MRLTQLEEKANDIRRDIVSMVAEAGSGHPGGSLSIADIMCALYFGDILVHDPANPQAETRDRFVLSKGHAAPALYATLAEAGYFPKEELMSLRKLKSRLQGHPDSKKCPGVEVSTGSLGQGLSISCGIACGLRLQGSDSRVITLLGDGECQEGQVWEAAMFGAHQKLGNLIAIIDSNGLQIDGNVDDVCSPGDIAAKFKAFGWDVVEFNGNDIAECVEVLSAARARQGNLPQALIAHTTKGKGVSFMENNAGWHGKAPKPEELAVALKELNEKEAVRG